MTLIIHPQVRRDLREILDYYDGRSDQAGDHFLAELEAALDHIEAEPLRCHPLDDQQRRCNLHRFPYHVVFEVKGDWIGVMVIRHHKRKPSYGLRRRWK